MAIDYNANLIAELYATGDEEKATRVCDEMVAIGDPIFPRQIYEAYKKFRKTMVSHYFVSDLTTFKTTDVVEILKEIAHTSNRDADISMMVGYLTNIEYFDKEIVNKVKKIFKDDISSGELYEDDVEKYFVYLEKSGEDIGFLESLLQTCFEDDEQDLRVRKIALKKLLKLKAKKYINYYYENYNSLKGKKAEIIFTEETSKWHGGIIPSLHKRVLEIGSERAKEILQKEQLKKIEEKKIKEMKEQKEIKEEYETADVISDIAKLRSNINKVSIADERFGFSFFSPSEEIYQQGKPAGDKASLVGYCIVLRSLIGDFDNKIIELEISQERAVKLLPDIKEFKGSINKFHLLLLEKEINVDSEIFGLRNLSRIVSKLAHPSEETDRELSNILKEERLFDYYKESNWSILHREILLRYKGVLEKLMSAISAK